LHQITYAHVKPIDGLFPGFVLTLSGYQLTGQLGEILELNGHHSITFMNDFGTVYQYHPRMVHGFFYKNEEKAFYFESKYDGKYWLFLQLLFREKGVSLYQAPEMKTQWIMDNGMLRPFSYPVLAFFLDFSNSGHPIKLTRASYKKKLILLFKKRNPELASKIGKPGYKFQHLPKIVKEFSESLLDKDKIIL
jgi:hypothetical protein